MIGRASKRKAYHWGQWAESLCVIFLRLKGYRIIDRDLREKVGEIDIIAKRGRALVFVEVKARRTHASAAESVSAGQRRRITRAAQSFMAKHPRMLGLDQRFDVVLVAPWRFPHHIQDAWRPDF